MGTRFHSSDEDVRAAAVARVKSVAQAAVVQHDTKSGRASRRGSQALRAALQLENEERIRNGERAKEV